MSLRLERCRICFWMCKRCREVPTSSNADPKSTGAVGFEREKTTLAFRRMWPRASLER